MTNHFDHFKYCLTGSTLVIPFVAHHLPRSSSLPVARELPLSFATHTGARRAPTGGSTIDWVGDKDHRLETFVTSGQPTRFIKPPTARDGNGWLETRSATVDVADPPLTVATCTRGTGCHAGLEVHEVENRLLKMVAPPG